MRISLLLCALVAVAGCSNHPLIDEKARLSTYQVIHKVRCEAKEALDKHYEEEMFSDNESGVAELTKEIKALKTKLSGSGFSEAQRNTKLISEELRKTKGSLLRSAAAIDVVQPKHEQLKLTLENKLNAIKDTKDEFKNKKNDQIFLLKSIEQAKDILALQGEYSKLTKRLDELQEKADVYEAIGKELGEQFSNATEAGKEYQTAAKDLKEKTKTLKNKEKSVGALAIFQETNIAMQFRFEITENNDATAGGSFEWPIHFGSFKIAYESGAKKKRLSERAVGVEASFKELRKVNCDNAHTVDHGHAHIYPIRGKIGVAEVVAQYLTLAKEAKLSTSSVNKKLYTDKVQFTTTFNAGIDPSFTLKPTPAHTIAFAGTYDASRKDFHEVIIDIAPAKPAAAPKQPGQVLAISSLPDLVVRVEEPY